VRHRVKLSDQNKDWHRRRVRSLARKESFRAERKRFLIVCEGGRTEPDYFNAIRRILPRHVVEVVIEGQGMNTITLVREAIKLRNEKSGIDSYDETWVVFDKDDFPVHDFDNAVKMCKQYRLKPVYSNQAFELWYILHFEARQTGIHRNQYKRILTRHLGETYRKNDAGMFDKINAKGSEAEAIRRAKRLHKDAPKPPSSANPCTTVYALVEELNKFKPPAGE